MRALIVGCGYTGLPLGLELIKQGHEVWGMVRSAERADQIKSAGVQPLVADVTQPGQLEKVPRSFDWVINLVSSSKGGLDDYRRVYLEGTKHLVTWLAAEPPRKFVYTSSTGVYGQIDGSQVKESSQTEPSSETSKVLVETEQQLLNAFQQTKFPAIILRVAGIYGPDRGHYFKQFLRNEARLAGHGERYLNMIHVDDVVGVILTARKNGRPGEIYNAVDDEPVMQIHFFRWLSETLGKWMPPSSTEEDEETRKRSATHKKVLNRKLKMEIGYTFRYPTFRQGYTAEIQRLQDAGQLDIEPEPR